MKPCKLILATAMVLVASCARGPRDGDYTLEILTTNDVHGTYFDSTYVGGAQRRSLLAVNTYVDSVRAVSGAGNVVLLDDGDFLQGDNAAYYFNYVDTLSPHLYPRLAQYMGYDAISVGNHDIETGHSVYDRVRSELESKGIAFLAGNAVRESDGKPYFQKSVILKKNGLKVAVLGYTNPNMKAWLGETVWSGIDFKSLIPLVQQDVDEIIEKEHPHVVIVAPHSGTGSGDGSQYESQCLDLLNSLHGVDFVIASHDHRPRIERNGEMFMINSGSHCRNLGHGKVSISIKDGKVVSKTLSADLIAIDPTRTDETMRTAFQSDYETVKAFTTREIGELKSDLVTREAYAGMSDYINLIHTVSLSCAPAKISFAAPLTQNGTVKAGTMVYNDLFTIYPYENQLYVVEMTGAEIRNYLEYSYSRWINPEDGRILNITSRPDARYGNTRWSFAVATYGLDSAAGINYAVDVTKPVGSRVEIFSLADGTTFSLEEKYPVAMTSYRASGGEGLLSKGAGLESATVDERTVARYPEIRELVYQFILAHDGVLDSASMSDPAVLGHWNFAPVSASDPGQPAPAIASAIARDLELVFGR